MDPRLRRALELVGESAPDEGAVAPVDLAARFRAGAPRLAELLEHSGLVEAARRCQVEDARAAHEQRRFRRLHGLATAGLFGTTCAGAALAMCGLLAPTALELVSLALSLASLLMGALAVVALHLLAGDEPLARWMRARAEAEAARSQYFALLGRRLAELRPADVELQLLGLELFRRFQLDAQCAYYRRRALEHRSSRRATTRIGALGALVLALGAGVAGLHVPGHPELDLRPLAAVSAIGAAIAALATRREAFRQDAHNAERYEHAQRALGLLRAQHSEVQLLVLAGHGEALVRYVDAVQGELALEHRQWLKQEQVLERSSRELSSELAALHGAASSAAGKG